MRTVDVTPKKQNDEGCTVRLGASVPPGQPTTGDYPRFLRPAYG